MDRDLTGSAASALAFAVASVVGDAFAGAVRLARARVGGPSSRLARTDSPAGSVVALFFGVTAGLVRARHGHGAPAAMAALGLLVGHRSLPLVPLLAWFGEAGRAVAARRSVSGRSTDRTLGLVLTPREA